MASPQATPDPLLGRSIGGKYEIVSFIGRGGMGAVYKARQRALKRPVAVKVLHPHHSKDGTFVGRFRREATSASRLDHPNLMRVLDFGQEPDGLLYLVMEYLDGRDLLKVLRDEGGWLPGERIVDVLSQVLAALAVAHEEGIIHRDLKPENIVVVRGKDDDGAIVEVVKVCDFGIAKTFDAPDEDKGEWDGATFSATITATGALVGTPEYMSPEQAKGERLDARSDLYAIGVILYLMLTGRLPFSSANSMKVVLKHVTEEPEPPSKFRNVDLRLEAVCLRALRKAREDRFANAREMRAVLRAALGLRDSAVMSSRFSLPSLMPSAGPIVSDADETPPRDAAPSVPSIKIAAASAAVTADPFDKDAPTLVEGHVPSHRSDRVPTTQTQDDRRNSSPAGASSSVRPTATAAPSAAASREPSIVLQQTTTYPSGSTTIDREPAPETRLVRRGPSPVVISLVAVIAVLALLIMALLFRK